MLEIDVLDRVIEIKRRGGWTEADFDKLANQTDEEIIGDCPKCPRILLSGQPDLGEVYEFNASDGRMYLFDVLMGRQLAEGQQVVISREDLLMMGIPAIPGEIPANAGVTVIEPHLAHLTARGDYQPGLIAQVPTPNGPRAILIDGAHTATVQVRAGVEFVYALLLTVEQTKAICFHGWPEEE